MGLHLRLSVLSKYDKYKGYSMIISLARFDSGNYSEEGRSGGDKFHPTSFKA